jgi:hypothetical protein
VDSVSDTVAYCTRMNKTYLNKKWFTFYMTVDNATEEEKVDCYFSISNGREN